MRSGRFLGAHRTLYDSTNNRCASITETSWVLTAIACLLLAGCSGDNSAQDDSSGTDDTTTADGSEKARSGKLAGGSSSSQVDPLAGLPIDEPLPEIKVSVPERPAPKDAQEAVETLKKISESYTFSAIPQALTPPFSKAAAVAYCKAMKHLEARRKADLTWLKAVDAEKLGADNIQSQMLVNNGGNLIDRLENYVSRDINSSLTTTRATLKLNIASDTRLIKQGADVDMSDQTRCDKSIGQREHRQAPRRGDYASRADGQHRHSDRPANRRGRIDLAGRERKRSSATSNNSTTKSPRPFRSSSRLKTSATKVCARLPLMCSPANNTSCPRLRG